MWLFFGGFALSFAYGLFGAGLLYVISGKDEARVFFALYVGSFNTLIALGLITGTTLIVGCGQKVLPATIERVFTKTELAATDYFRIKGKFYSSARTVVFALELVIIGAVVFAYCGFPMLGLGKVLMIVAGCIQWALASYVGRKLRYATTMLHALLSVPVNRNVFKTRSLDIINTAVTIASTLTLVFVYIHVHSYYYGPFVYASSIGSSAQVFLLLPAVLASPVLLMINFFPRHVLREIYNKPIAIDLQALQELLGQRSSTRFENQLRILELAKVYRDEIRLTLQPTLADLPIGITLLLMVAEPLIRR